MTSKKLCSKLPANGTAPNNSNSNASLANGSSSNQDQPEAGSEKPADSQNSGYSADGSAAVNPPVFIDLQQDGSTRGSNGSSHSNQSTSSPTSSTSHDHSTAKRRKKAELNFTASNALKDMKKGGLSIPKIEQGKTLELDGYKIDMTKVKLKSSKTIGNSPFLLVSKQQQQKKNKADEKNASTPSCSDYQSLFLATYKSYEKVDVVEWGDSSTSSVTSSESQGGACTTDSSSSPETLTPALNIPPLLEDALKAQVALKVSEEAKAKRAMCKRKRSSNDKTKIVHPLEKLPYFTMNDALEASDEARLVTLSFSPYIVVHVNNAYTRLTGFSSVKALGRPLHECLGRKCKEWMDACTATYPVAALQDRSAGICSKGNKRNTCRFKTSLVGPQLEGEKKGVDTSTTTHFVIGIIPVQETNQAKDEGGKADSSNNMHAPQDRALVAPVGAHSQVMG